MINPKIEAELISVIERYPYSNDVPVAAIIVDKNWNKIAIGINDREQHYKISGHAELNTLNQASTKLKKTNLKDYKIISTLEPCIMCLEAIKQAKIKEIYYYASSPKFGFLNLNHNFDIFKLKVVKIENKFTKNISKKLRIFFQKIRK